MRIDPRDQTAQGDPETVVLLPTGGALVGLYIKGVTGTSMLGIREDTEGQPVSMAIGDLLEIDTSRVQSNPRRAPDREDDGA